MKELPKIHLVPITHRGTEVICLRFGYEPSLHELSRKLNCRWSQTHKCWYVEKSEGVYERIQQIFTGAAIFDPPIVAVPENKEEIMVQKFQLPVLFNEQEEEVQKLIRYMRSKRYSESTVSTYSEALRIFFRYFSNKVISEIDNNDLIVFNNEYILKNKLSASYQNQIINAIKLYFTNLLRKQLHPELVHRPKRAKVLPNVLSKEEVKAVLGALNNVKHKTMLSLVYACGLRCGELLKLKPAHVDENRRLLIVKQAKGRKDRIVPLSDKITQLLHEYLHVHKPVIYLFEGQTKGEMYDERSFQNVLKNAVEKAGINKPVTLHWLRHSYATHLLENGTDLRYIQEILGHSSSRTTEIYTHVSNLSIQKIVSPFDHL